jgi:hypothetical protein
MPRNMITIAGGIVAGVITLGGVAGGTYLVEDRYAKQELLEKHEELAGLSIEQITIGQSRALQKLDASNQLSNLRARKNSIEDRIWYLQSERRQLEYYQNFGGKPFEDRDYTYQLNSIDLDLERFNKELEAITDEIEALNIKLNTLD